MENNQIVKPLIKPYAPSWWAGRTEEYFDIGGPFATRGEAIDCGRKQQSGDAFYVALCRMYSWSSPDANDTISQWIDDHECLWFDDGFPGFDRAIDETSAEQDLQTVLNDWFSRHCNSLPMPTSFISVTCGEWIPGQSAP